MNKKIIIAVVVALVVVAVIAAVVVLGSRKVELNLQELDTTISAKEPFSQMATMAIDADVLTTLYEISEEDYEEVVGQMPMMNIQASMYLIIKAKQGKVDAVKEKVDEYAQKQEQIWSTYLPEQYDLVKARRSNVVGDYVYLIIAENAEEIEGLIKK